MIYYTIKLCFSCLKFSLPAHFTVFPRWLPAGKRKEKMPLTPSKAGRRGSSDLRETQSPVVSNSRKDVLLSGNFPSGEVAEKQKVMNYGPPPGPEILEGGAGHRNQSGCSREVCVAQGGGWSVKDWCLWSQGFPKALDTWNLSSLCHPPPGTRNAGIMGLNFPAGKRIRYLCQENKVGASCSPFLLL